MYSISQLFRFHLGDTRPQYTHQMDYSLTKNDRWLCLTSSMRRNYTANQRGMPHLQSPFILRKCDGSDEQHLLALQSKDREELKGRNDKRNIWNRRILFPSRVMIHASRHQTLWLPILFWPHHGVRAIVRVSPRVSFHLRVHSSRKEQLPFLHGSMAHGGDAPNTRVKCALDKLEFQVSFRVA